MASSCHLKNRLDLDRHAERQRNGTKGAPDAHATVRPPHLGEELTTSVDHMRMLREVGRTVHEPHELHDPRDTVETAERVDECCEDGEPREPGGSLSGIRIKVVTDTAFQEHAVGLKRQVPRNVGERAHDEERLVGSGRLANWGKDEAERAHPRLW